jgi:uncharacterized protein
MPGTPLTPREAFAAIQDFTLHGTDITGLYADDAVHEWPFHVPGGPQRLSGRAEIAAFFDSVRAGNSPLRFDEFTSVVLHDAADPEVLIAEYGLRGTVVPAGKPFSFCYILVLRVHDGKIAFVRDYLNPLAMTEALTPAPAP